ncbi:hypothetical protein M3Y98_01209600 [Aphelenchoides besseyi]|nr:hypothetical protein M3Y98_01209600 [Aphelenchoides besseyi]KAI6193219.1 hypothetical protein M3Y96_00995400 [Aphelenchoides besseyi]
METGIKKELIDGINPLISKNEPFVKVESSCSASDWFASYNCSVIAYSAFNAHLAQLDLDYNVQVSVTAAGIRVANHAFTHVYNHGLSPRTYSSSLGNHCIVVIVHNLSRPAMVINGEEIESEIYNLRLTFKNSGHHLNFCWGLEQQNYHLMD